MCIFFKFFKMFLDFAFIQEQSLVEKNLQFKIFLGKKA